MGVEVSAVLDEEYVWLLHVALRNVRIADDPHDPTLNKNLDASLRSRKSCQASRDLLPAADEAQSLLRSQRPSEVSVKAQSSVRIRRSWSVLADPR